MIVPEDRYYVAHEVQQPSRSYWAPTEDPDGVLRDRLTINEEKQYLADIAGELAFTMAYKPQSVLDIGCGPGWYLSAIKAAWKCGTEICPIAKREAQRRGLSVEASCEPFADGSFDLVRCHHVIEHMANPVAEIDEIRRVAKAWLIISTPDFASPCAQRFGKCYRMLHDETHCSLFTNESMHRFLRDHGFTIRQVEYPFPQRYATTETMNRWRHRSLVSPPWPGNWMTFYCRIK